MRQGAGPYNQYLVECLRCAHSQTATTARTRGENRPRHSKRGNGGGRYVRQGQQQHNVAGARRKTPPMPTWSCFLPAAAGGRADQQAGQEEQGRAWQGHRVSQIPF